MPRGGAIFVVPVVRSLYVFLFLACISLTSLSAQVTGDDLNGQGSLRDTIDTVKSYSTSPNTGVLVFTISAERKGHPLNRQALLKLVNLATQSPMWQTTEGNSQGPYLESAATGVFTNVPYGSYDVEASAAGYLSIHQAIHVASAQVQQQIEIVLERDPAAINLDAAGQSASPKVRKAAQRAVSALKSGKLDQAQKLLVAALATAPGDLNLNVLAGYLYFEKKDFEKASSYLSAATTANPHNAQALILLGRAKMERRDYTAARSALEQAVLANDQNWLPHDLLAAAYLHEKNFPRARDEAEVAIASGKSSANSALLVLGQAQLNLGNNRQGLDALNAFLQQSPRQPFAGQVRKLIAEVEGGRFESGKTASSIPSDTDGAPTKSAAKIAGVDPLLAMPADRLLIKGWHPAGVDDVQLALAPGVSCPAEQVIEESGKRVQELVDDLAKFSAIEDLLHQSLDEYGLPLRTENRKFNYVAAITELQPGFLSVDEYRADNLSLPGYPDGIASTGFATLALVFHPHMHDSFDMVCEGLGDWHGQAAWLVHFRQRDDRPNHMHSYKVGNQYHSVKLKGRAWITSDKFQIVRIEAEMVSPMPEIQLLTEHQIVEYGPIPFKSKNTSLFLPTSAEIYFDFRKHRYYRRHSFDHYMLFSTDTNEKIKEPVAKPATEKKSQVEITLYSQ